MGREGAGSGAKRGRRSHQLFGRNGKCINESLLNFRCFQFAESDVNFNVIGARDRINHFVAIRFFQKR